MPPVPPLTRRHGNLSLLAGAALHIITRDGNGTWSPDAAILKTLPSIDNFMFRSDRDDNWRGGTTHEYLGFIRMTKTGSTSMLNFFNRATRLQTFDKHIWLDKLIQRLEADPPAAMKTVFLTPPCMFGYHLAPNQTNISKALPTAGYQCQHLSYHHLITQFAKMLDLYRLESAVPLRVTLGMTTVVRDPVDRYLSYFHYWRSVYPAWNSTARPEERAALVSGDFAEFLRLVAESPRRGLNSAFQYEYLAQNVDYSIDLVNDRRVLPLVNECFNASVLLLTDLYPRYFSVNETLHFLQTSASLTNSRSKVAQDPKFLSRKGLEPVKAFDLDLVKASARQWLERDHRFYEASAAMFVRHLQASRVDRDEVHRCLERLSAEAAKYRHRLGNGNFASRDVE
jgi:Sulfotransferase family